MRYIMCFLCFSLGSFNVLAEQIYQWVDEQGNIQFSQTPPAHLQAQKLELQAPQSIHGSGPKPTQAKPKTEDKPKQMTSEQAQAYNCRVARDNLLTAQKNKEIHVANAEIQEQDTSSVIKAEDAKITAAQQKVDKFCSAQQTENKAAK